MRSTLLPQRIHRYPKRQDEIGCSDAEGDSWFGGSGSCKKKAGEIVEKLKEMKLGKAAETLERGAEETFAYYSFPMQQLEAVEDEQPSGKDQQGDPKKDPSG